MEQSRRTFLLIGGGAGIALAFIARRGLIGAPVQAAAPGEAFEVSHSDAEWHKILTPAQYSVLRNEGTELPFTSPLLDEHRNGVFSCAGCALDLYSSTTKYESGTGWPSYWQPLDNAVGEHVDSSFGEIRTEIHCRRCGGHLGHVFNDGPKPTGLRYCMNGVALSFKAADA